MKKLLFLFLIILFIPIAGCNESSGSNGSSPIAPPTTDSPDTPGTPEAEKQFVILEIKATNRGLPAESVDWKYDVSDDYIKEDVAGESQWWRFNSAETGYFVEKIGKAAAGETAGAYIGVDNYGSTTRLEIYIFSSKSGGLLYELSIRVDSYSEYNKYFFPVLMREYAIDWIKTYPENSYNGYDMIEY